MFAFAAARAPCTRHEVGHPLRWGPCSSSWWSPQPGTCRGGRGSRAPRSPPRPRVVAAALVSPRGRSRRAYLRARRLARPPVRACLLLAGACAGRPRARGGSSGCSAAPRPWHWRGCSSSRDQRLGGSRRRPSVAGPVPGLGENPNTAALLFAVTADRPRGAVLATRARRALAGRARPPLSARSSPRARGAGSSRARWVPSCSSWRGAAARVAPLSPWRRSAAASARRSRRPSPSRHSGGPVVTPSGPPKAGAGVSRRRAAYPLNADVGRPLPGGAQPPVTRAASSAAAAGSTPGGARSQVAGRPLLGYGFGTETRVFVDRYYAFDGGFPENSYIGTLLQLGVVGARAARRPVARAGLERVPGAAARDGAARRPPRPACCSRGLVIGLTSVVRSTRSATSRSRRIWICVLTLSGARRERRR